MLLARVTTIVPHCLPGNRTTYTPFSAYITQTAVMPDDSRGRETGTGWARGLLSGHACEEGEGGA